MGTTFRRKRLGRIRRIERLPCDCHGIRRALETLGMEAYQDETRRYLAAAQVIIDARANGTR